MYCPVTVQRLNARQLDICRVPCCRAPHASKFYLVRLVVCSVITGMSASSAIRPTLPGAQVGTGNRQDVPVIAIVRSSIHYAANRLAGRMCVCNELHCDRLVVFMTIPLAYSPAATDLAYSVVPVTFGTTCARLMQAADHC